MINECVRIKNEHGLHARPAAHFVKIAGKFQSDIKVLKDGLVVNGKSIMGIMMLAAEKGSDIILQIEGPDEIQAFHALVELIDSNFYEDEK